MRRDRVAEDVYTFTSDRYAQVTAGAILTSEGTIVIDTLPFPEETQELLDFVEKRGQGPVRYVILTHHHSDHTNGTFLFPQAEVLAHPNCRLALQKWGAESLAEARKQTRGLREVEIRLPTAVSQDDFYLHLGARSLYITALPGHTDNCIGVLVEGDKILFAGDAMLPVPHFLWGDIRDSARSLRAIRSLKPESVVQGHGQLLLRGELAEEIEASLEYLRCLEERVGELVQQNAPESALYNIDIESCGKSRVPLDGLVQHLHNENLYALYMQMKGERKPRRATSAPVM